VRAPTRVLIVEDIETWVYTLSRAARRAGATEIVVCESLAAVRDELRKARFDLAILDVGLDPDDDLNSDGVLALEAIRDIDGGGTRCVLITGWQGGDRMNLQSSVHDKYGIDWAYMKEKYEAHAVVGKLTELLEEAFVRRLAQRTPMENLHANAEPWRFDAQLLDALSPAGGMQTLYAAITRLLTSAIPVIAMQPFMPMQKGPGGVCVGLYWSRALATAVAVGLAPAAGRRGDNDSAIPADLARVLPDGMVPDLIEKVRERNILGWLWELPGLDRDKFAG
jgi:CheY-like chemotaxis protein